MVVSDMAPNLSGIAASRRRAHGHLVELAVEFAVHHLQARRAPWWCKAFHGSGYSQLVKLFKRATFRVVKPIKPKASRDKSAETFLVGVGLKAANLKNFKVTACEPVLTTRFSTALRTSAPGA